MGFFAPEIRDPDTRLALRMLIASGSHATGGLSVNPRTETSPSAQTLPQLAGKYMSFELAGEAYGIEILSVREIVAAPRIRPVPRAPPAIKGVMNLRGRILPVVDLRRRLALPAAEPGNQAVTIVVQYPGEGTNVVTFGLLVDQVLEVLPLSDGDVEPPPELGPRADDSAVVGVGKSQGRVIFLLDVARVVGGAACA